MNHGNGSITTWESFDKPGHTQFLESTINTTMYERVIVESLRPSVSSTSENKAEELNPSTWYLGANAPSTI